MDYLTAGIIPLIAALLGGGLAFLGASSAIRKNSENEEKRIEKNLNKSRALEAYSGFYKLQNIYTDAATLQIQLEQMFEEAEAEEMEPWAKVKQLVVNTFHDSAVRPNESLFLIEADKPELLNDVHLSQQRVWNIGVAAGKYNELRERLELHLLENAEDVKDIDGTQVGGYLEGRAEIIARSMEETLNDLLAQIVEAIENNDKNSFRIASQFKSEAEKYFGDDFPKFGFERVQ